MLKTVIGFQRMNKTTLGTIQFPIYRVGYRKPEFDGTSYYFHKTNPDTGIDRKIIVDSKEFPGDSLALRRLRMLAENRDLFQFRIALFFIGDLIKMSKPRLWFMDSNGKLFTYTKTSMARLIIKPIEKVIGTGSGYVIKVKDIETRFKCLYAPKSEIYAGILKIGHVLILYGVYTDPPQDTIRKV